MRAIDGYPQTPVRNALKLLALTFARPGELRHAEWSQFTLDGETPEWNIPAEQMKMRRPHWLPLAPRAMRGSSRDPPDLSRFHCERPGGLFVPAFGSVDDPDNEEHDRYLDEYADNGSQCGT